MVQGEGGKNVALGYKEYAETTHNGSLIAFPFGGRAMLAGGLKSHPGSQATHLPQKWMGCHIPLPLLGGGAIDTTFQF